MKIQNLFLATILFGVVACENGDTSLSYESGFNGSYSNDGNNPYPPSGDTYAEYEENPFVNVSDSPVSTFSIDADGASYANVRRFILQDLQIPPKGAVRTEELINYFDLDYEYQSSAHPISLNGEVSSCPWAEGHKLIRIGIKGKPIPQDQLPPSNFVFLIDVSGSMSGDDRLDLLKEGFQLFVNQMREDDRVAIVTYAGNAGLALESTSGHSKVKIKNAINSLGAGGSTAGAEGIITAYQIALENFVQKGNNRVILGTDGDFNVGVSDPEKLVELIEDMREDGVFLTVLGVGRGNFKDAALEQIANHGNGTYEYIDNVDQLKKVFIHEYSKFYTVAKDVKVQVRFNPEIVKSYRLIGYENRLLNTEDFEDDTKDAGEIGSNQNITALYEIIPNENIDNRQLPTFEIDFRYKQPDEDLSLQLKLEIFDEDKEFIEASDQMILSGSVSAFSMLLRDSPYKGTSGYPDILQNLEKVDIDDPHGLIEEFEQIVIKAKGL
jgi:Ca-activated chloride channel family protein